MKIVYLYSNDGNESCEVNSYVFFRKTSKVFWKVCPNFENGPLYKHRGKRFLSHQSMTERKKLCL